ncbi:MAG: ABC transporter permease [Propionibacteriaceae bacterium]|jgi:D-xylose transport system permease protein|nr:ABC transporter permease [Propionibacteriaceae bacterium]
MYLTARLAQSFKLRSAGVVYALALIVGLLTLLSAAQGKPFYLSVLNVQNILDQSSMIAIMAIFMTLVLITGSFDLSVGSVAALSGATALSLLDGYGPVVATAAAIAIGLVSGVVNGLLVEKVGVNAFIVTLGTCTAIRGLVLALLDGHAVSPKSTFYYDIMSARPTLPVWAVLLIALALAGFGGYRAFTAKTWTLASVVLVGLGVLLALLGIFVPDLFREVTAVWVLLVLLIGSALYLRFTTMGRYLYATGANTEAARLSGINTSRYKIGVFIAMSLACSLVGLIFAGKFNSMDPNSLSGTELTVIAAAVLGGTSLQGGSGYTTKSVLGALILFTLSNGFNILNLGSNYQYFIQGIVLVAAATVYTVAGRQKKHQAVMVEEPISA